MSKQDTQFFNSFSVIIGLLSLAMLMIFATARHFGETRQAAQIKGDPLVAQQISARTAPPVRIAVAGQDNSALAIAPVAAAATAAVAAPAAPESGDAVYDMVCAACHGGGIAGAPKTGDAAAWAPRRAEGVATLYRHAIEGYTGSTGTMPAKGGRTDISDDLVKAAVDHMLAM